MEFTKEELAFLEKSKKRMVFDDPLAEVNKRARSYVSFSSMTPSVAQRRALEDFANLDLTGIVRVPKWNPSSGDDAFVMKV